MKNNQPPLTMIEYGKLVTDEKISLIKAEGGWYESRELSGDELLDFICDKITEESEEVSNATERSDKVKELAGLILLLEKFRQANKISEQELAQAIKEKVGTGQIYETNTLLERASAPVDGHTVNSAKEDYILVIIDSLGRTAQHPIAAVTDRAARRIAKKIIDEHGDAKNYNLAKQLSI